MSIQRVLMLSLSSYDKHFAWFGFDQVMNTMFIEFFTCAKLNFFYLIDDAHDDSSDRHGLANEFAHSHLNHAMPYRKQPKIPTVCVCCVCVHICEYKRYERSYWIVTYRLWQHTPCDTTHTHRQTRNRANLHETITKRFQCFSAKTQSL